MKNLLILFITLAIAGFGVSCDKDDDDNNSFNGTVWKYRRSETTYQRLPYVYEVYYFDSNSTYQNWTEDENGCVISYHINGTYIVDIPKSQLILDQSPTWEIKCDYNGDPPSHFTFHLDGGVRRHFYRQ